MLLSQALQLRHGLHEPPALGATLPLPGFSTPNAFTPAARAMFYVDMRRLRQPYVRLPAPGLPPCPSHPVLERANQSGLLGPARVHSSPHRARARGVGAPAR